MPGGFLGVVIFFVLAGYYTTRSFLISPTFDLPKFYWGRVKRLWPPLLFLITVLTLFCGFFLPEVFLFIRKSALGALSGTSNILQVLSEHSYFDRHGNFDPLTHLWALSLEMQFYLAFPLLYRILDQIGERLNARLYAYRRELMGTVFALMALASTVYMALQFVPGTDPTRLYYNSLARASAFLVGAAVSALLAGLQIRRFESGLPPKQFPRSVASLFSWIALGLLVAGFFLIDSQSVFLYSGGMTLYSLVAVLFLIYGANEPPAGLGWLFRSAPFRWLASRSYPFYLWQYALMMVVEAWFRFSTLNFWYRFLIQLALLLPISEISWRLFQKPEAIRVQLKVVVSGLMTLLLSVMLILPPPVLPEAPEFNREVALRAIEANASQESLRAQREEASRQLLQTTEITPVVSSAPSQAPSETTSQPDTSGDPSSQTNPGEPGSDNTSNTAPSGTEGSPTPAATTAIPVAPAVTAGTASNPYGYTEEQIKKLGGLRPVMIGDSVLAMATEGLRLYIPNVVIDAEVSRHFFQGPALLQSYDAGSVKPDIVVVALATNGDIQEKDMETYYTLANGRPLIFVNTVVPGTWEQPNNQKLANFAASHQKVYIADWYATAKNHPEYFYQDATHPIPDGAVVYDQVILNTILEALGK